MEFNGFTIFILAIIGAVTFFHYTQGFFSSTISAVICVIAAVLAVSYHETVTESLLGGKLMPNTANSMVLLLMFALIYLIPRTAMDSMVPGNVTLPAVVDKVGAAVMGLVAAVFAAGVVAFAAQQMPLGASLLGYSRFSVDTREATVPLQPRSLDRFLMDVMEGTTLDEQKQDEAKPVRLVVPVDDILVDTVQKLSEGGSLSGATPLRRVHPNWLTETFGQRVGIEPGGKRVALPGDAELFGLYALPYVQQKDADFSTFQRAWPGGKLPPAFPATQPSTPAAGEKEGGAAPAGGARPAAARSDAPGTGKMLVIARVMFKRNAADKDRLIRFSPGSVRLVTKKKSFTDPSGTEWTNYFPIGTYDPAKRIMYRNRPDDYLFLNEGAEPVGSDKGADFVFYVETAGFLAGDAKPDAKGARKPSEGSFLEVKRHLRFPLDEHEILSGAAVATKFKASPEIQVMRKPNIVDPPVLAGDVPPPPPPTPETPTTQGAAPAPGTTPTPDPAKPPTPENSFVLDVTGVKVSNRFFAAIKVPPSRSGGFSQIPGGVASVKDKKLTYISLAPTDVNQLRGDVIELHVPDGQAMVQMEADATNAPFGKVWDWYGMVGNIGFKDDKGTVHKAVGAWANFELNGTEHLVCGFQSNPAEPLMMPRMSAPQARPGKVWIAGYAPKGVRIKEVVMGNEVLKSGQDVAVE